MKRGTPKHPKVYDLCDALNIDRPTALGYLELLWHFTAEFAPQGNIGRYSDRRIEAAIDWSGKGKPAGRFIEAATKCGWCDADPAHRLLIHDWKDHADESVKKKLQRSGLWFHEPTPKVTGQVLASDVNKSASDADNGSPPCPAVASPCPAVSSPCLAVASQQDADRRGDKHGPELERHEQARALVDRLAATHPTPGNVTMAYAAAERVLSEAVDLPLQIQTIERSHARYCQYWQAERLRRPNGFIPQLHRWFGDGDPPPTAGTNRRPTKGEDAVMELAKHQFEKSQRGRP